MATQVTLAARVTEISEVDLTTPNFNGAVVRVGLQFTGNATSPLPVPGKDRGGFHVYVSKAAVASLSIVHDKVINVLLDW